MTPTATARPRSLAGALTPDQLRAARRLVARVRREVPAHLVQASLFGSQRARRGPARLRRRPAPRLRARCRPTASRRRATRRRSPTRWPPGRGVPVTVWSRRPGGPGGGQPHAHAGRRAGGLRALWCRRAAAAAPVPSPRADAQPLRRTPSWTALDEGRRRAGAARWPRARREPAARRVARRPGAALHRAAPAAGRHPAAARRGACAAFAAACAPTGDAPPAPAAEVLPWAARSFGADRARTRRRPVPPPPGRAAAAARERWSCCAAACCSAAGVAWSVSSGRRRRRRRGAYGEGDGTPPSARRGPRIRGAYSEAHRMKLFQPDTRQRRTLVRGLRHQLRDRRPADGVLQHAGGDADAVRAALGEQPAAPGDHPGAARHDRTTATARSSPPASPASPCSSCRATRRWSRPRCDDLQPFLGLAQSGRRRADEAARRAAARPARPSPRTPPSRRWPPWRSAAPPSPTS